MGPGGLKASIWASAQSRPSDTYRFDSRSRSVPPVSASTTTTTTAAPGSISISASAGATAPSLSPAQAFRRFHQTCQRLRWTAVDLENSYHRAHSPQDSGFSAADAEVNFKIDFHEFYMRIEQALVLVLLVYGVSVPRGFGGPRGQATHSYHHNVLLALGEEDNPLRSALGTGDVNSALWKAKELRNRWKDAAEGETTPLGMYDLSWIIGRIIEGLGVAYKMAAARVEELKVEANGNADNGADGSNGADDNTWGWMMADPMDLEP
ncbi:hypothetical protein ACSS6W_009778 [Trichoderma asperelloides]|uniref:Fungal specific transcription factor n=1 Tax=Trichoderma asperellum TaxID=101201 RepID=A0A6V8R3S3_TRIAP|nr:hypothetical protein LI328DRAFT_117800 [Trichoderma asperelloides]GFP59677.1 hypothetical protein TASIC1_0014009900 [Trichoderma asperellum]